MLFGTRLFCHHSGFRAFMCKLTRSLSLMAMGSFSCSSLSFFHYPQPTRRPPNGISAGASRNPIKRTLFLCSSRPPLFLLGKTLNLNPSTSFLPRVSCSHSPPNLVPGRKTPTFLSVIAEGAAVLLLGSLFFLGGSYHRTALALNDHQRSNLSTPLEERVEEIEEDDEAAERYARILEKNPSDVAALKSVLYGKMRKGKTKETVKYVERLIELEPDEVEWRLLQALSYELMGKLGNAKKLFKEILEERPLLIRALHGLALAMHKSGEGPAAFEMLNKALELAHHEDRVTEEQNIKLLIAQMHIVKGDLEGASKRFQDLVNENPRDFRPYLCQGIVYSLLDKKKEADEQFEMYRSLVPDELPQRSFIDDIIFSAKAESQSLKQPMISEVLRRK